MDIGLDERMCSVVFLSSIQRIASASFARCVLSFVYVFFFYHRVSAVFLSNCGFLHKAGRNAAGLNNIFFTYVLLAWMDHEGDKLSLIRLPFPSGLKMPGSPKNLST